MTADAPSGAYPTREPNWLGRAVRDVIVALLIGAVGYAHAQLISQSNQIATLTAQSISQQRQIDDQKLESAKKFDRIDDKLDKIIDELRKKP